MLFRSNLYFKNPEFSIKKQSSVFLLPAGLSLAAGRQQTWEATLAAFAGYLFRFFVILIRPPYILAAVPLLLLISNCVHNAVQEFLLILRLLSISKPKSIFKAITMCIKHYDEVFHNPSLSKNCHSLDIDISVEVHEQLGDHLSLLQ